MTATKLINCLSLPRLSGARTFSAKTWRVLGSSSLNKTRKIPRKWDFFFFYNYKTVKVAGNELVALLATNFCITVDLGKFVVKDELK